jgi:hypothetical protein
MIGKKKYDLRAFPDSDCPGRRANHLVLSNGEEGLVYAPRSRI